jgi:hypothetical protein
LFINPFQPGLFRRLILTVLSAAAELFAFTRLVRMRAHRTYPWFALYLLAGSPDSACLEWSAV